MILYLKDINIALISITSSAGFLPVAAQGPAFCPRIQIWTIPSRTLFSGCSTTFILSALAVQIFCCPIGISAVLKIPQARIFSVLFGGAGSWGCQSIGSFWLGGRSGWPSWLPLLFAWGSAVPSRTKGRLCCPEVRWCSIWVVQWGVLVPFWVWANSSWNLIWHFCISSSFIKVGMWVVSYFSDGGWSAPEDALFLLQGFIPPVCVEGLGYFSSLQVYSWFP